MNHAATLESPAPQAAAKTFNSLNPLRGFLGLDMAFRLLIWMTSFAAATQISAWTRAWPYDLPFPGQNFIDAWRWAWAIMTWILAFNMSYVLTLVALRILIPTPRPGVYMTNRKLDVRKTNDRQLFFACFVAVLTKARYEPPFPAFLVFHLASTPPLCWLMSAFFGPKNKSCNVSEPLILDPSFVEIGKNVVIGSNASIAGHIQVPNMVQIKKTIIEDDVLIGANALIFGGCHIKRAAMIAGGSVLPPYSVVGESEYWSGVPAVKIRDLAPRSQPRP